MIRTVLHFLYYLFYVATYGNSHKHNRAKYAFLTFIWNFQFMIACIIIFKFSIIFISRTLTIILAALLSLIMVHFIGKYFSNREKYVAIVNKYRKYGENRVILIRIIVIIF